MTTELLSRSLTRKLSKCDIRSLIEFGTDCSALVHSALYPRILTLAAAPQCISGRTSYHPTRLAFHSYPHLIRDFFNRLRFDPPPRFTEASIWTRIDRRASGLLRKTCALFRLAFASAPFLQELNFAMRNNSPAHFTKGIPSHPFTSEDINNAPIACRHTGSGLFTPLPGCFSPFPHGTFLYRSYIMFSLRPWSAQIQTEFHVLRPTQVSRCSYTSFAYGAFTLLDQLSQYCSARHIICNCNLHDPTTPVI